MAWLFMSYVYDNNDGMKESNWINDNRMGISFKLAIKYLSENGFVEFINDKWKITKKGIDELFSFFKIPTNRDEWLNYDNSWLKKYDTVQYPISRIPTEIFEREFEKHTSENIKYILEKSEYYDIGKWWYKYQRGTIGWWTKMNKYLGLKGDLMPDVDSLILYRGINLKCGSPDNEEYFNKEICIGIKNGEIKKGDKIKCNKSSWSLSSSVAKSFASGKKGLSDPISMKDTEIGIVLKNEFKSSEILLDSDWVNNHKFLKDKSVFPSEMEVIIQPKTRYVEIIHIFDNKN